MARQSSYRWALVLVAVPLFSVGIGQTGKRAVPSGQDRPKAQIRRAPHFRMITAAAKSHIAKTHGIMLDLSSTVLTYDVLHAGDTSGSLMFIHPNMINFKGGEALLDSTSGASMVSLQFTPLAVGTLHLVIFTITVGSGSVLVSSQVGGAPPTTQTLFGGTNYVPLLVQPTTTAQASVSLSASTGNFWFNQVTVELAK